MLDEWQEQYIRLIAAADPELGITFPLARLILIFSSLDIFAASNTHDGRSTCKAFKSWVDRYVDIGRIGCTASDLWGARCGILYTLRPDSDHSRAKKARTIFYTWGNKNTFLPSLNNAIDFVETYDQRGRVAISVDVLHSAVREGLCKYFDELDLNPSEKQKVGSRAFGFTSKFDEQVLKPFS